MNEVDKGARHRRQDDKRGQRVAQEEKDPFGLYKTERKMRNVRRWLKTQKDIPYPTATGDTLAAMGQGDGKPKPATNRRRKEAYASARPTGIRWRDKQRNYKDAVEATRAATGKEEEEIAKSMSRLTCEYCSPVVCDDTDEALLWCGLAWSQYPRLKAHH